MPPTKRADTMDGRRLHRALVVMIHTLTFRARACPDSDGGVGSDQTDRRRRGPAHWFRVSWAPPTDGAVTIKGSVFNDSQ